MTSNEVYESTKAKSPDLIVFVSKGDFFETFGDDAEIVSRVLRLFKTTRSSDGLVMVGFPKVRAEASIAALLRAGHKIGVVELTTGKSVTITPPAGDPEMN